jgi:hypothetical protein
MLLYADDSGCLGPVSPGKHPASKLAQVLSIESGDRKVFYTKVMELIDHGDDGEPLALVIADGHYHLTRFEDCQAVRSKGDHRAAAGQSSGSRRSVIGQSSGSHRAVTGQSLATNARKSFRTETELGTEDRSKKIEVRSKKIEDRSYDVDGDRSEDPEPDSTASASASSNGAADQDAGLWLREEYDRRWQARYGRPRNWTSYQIHFDSIVRQAAEQPGDTLAAMGAAMDAFLADPDQQQYGDHSPQSLAKLFHRYVAQHREQIEALESKRKGEAAERRYQEAKAAAEAKHWHEVQAKQQAGNSAAPAVVPGNNLGINPEEWS